MEKISVGRLLNWNFKNKWPGVLIALIICALGILKGTGIPIRLSLVDLLPESRESVQDFYAVSKEIGGVGYMGIIIGPTKNPSAAAQKVIDRITQLPEIRYAFHEREKYSLREKFLYLISRKEFNELLESSKSILHEGKSGGFLDLGFEDEKEKSDNVAEAKKNFAKIRDKYIGPQKSGFETANDSHFVSKDGQYGVVFAKPRYDGSDLGKSKELVDLVGKTVRETLGNDVPFNLWGRAVSQINDTEQINRDIVLTSLVGLFTLAFVLVWGLGTFRGAVVAIACVFLAMGWTVGAARIFVGQINIITGFLLAILGGLGVEYGIHLIRRYYQEMQAGVTSEEALRKTYVQVGRALFSAALTSSGAFFILAFSDFKGFSELGIIAGFGVLSIYSVYMLAFPAIGTFLRKEKRFAKSGEWFGFYPFKARVAFLIVPLIGVGVWGLSRAYFEYDFDKMRELAQESVRLDKLISSVNDGRSLTPTALLAKDTQQATEVRHWLEALPASENLHSVLSITSLLPEDLHQRDEKLAAFRKGIENVSDAKLREMSGVDPKILRRWIQQGPYKVQDLPPQLRDVFGKTGNILLVYTEDNLSHAHGIQHFSGLLKTAKEKFPGLRVGSDVMIFSEILHHVFYDGRIVMLLFFVGCFFVVWLDFRRFKDAAMLTFQLGFGMALLVALMGIFKVPFSIFNVAMIPAVLAAGIDMGVHVRHRELELLQDPLSSAKFMAQAVQLGALTTMIGFAALFLAHAPILKGIAWISCLGQVAMYMVCMVFWPVGKMAWQSRFSSLKRHP